MTKRRPIPHDRHHAILKSQNDELERVLQVVSFVPKLRELRVLLERLHFQAHPLKGRNMEANTRGRREFITEVGDHMVTLIGAGDTYPYRAMEDRYRKRLERMVEDLKEDLDPTVKRPRRPRGPQCLVQGCGWHGRFQSYGARLCGYCGAGFVEEAKVGRVG